MHANTRIYKKTTFGLEIYIATINGKKVTQAFSLAGVTTQLHNIIKGNR